jgi:DNA-binding response OmpR family regulator
MASIKPNTLRGYLQGISGLFISPENPGGLTPKELDILAILIRVSKSKNTHQLSSDVKSKAAELTNHSKQVITNYIKRLRDKKVITADNTIHPLLREASITITYHESVS